MHESKNRAQRRANTNNPSAGDKVRLNWHAPERRREDEQNEEPQPFEGPTGLGINMRQATALDAPPTLPKPER